MTEWKLWSFFLLLLILLIYIAVVSRFPWKPSKILLSLSPLSETTARGLQVKELLRNKQKTKENNIKKRNKVNKWNQLTYFLYRLFPGMLLFQVGKRSTKKSPAISQVPGVSCGDVTREYWRKGVGSCKLPNTITFIVIIIIVSLFRSRGGAKSETFIFHRTPPGSWARQVVDAIKQLR